MRTVDVDYPAEIVKFEPKILDLLEAECKEFKVAVHVGSHWTLRWLSLKFGEVWAFEPDVEKFIDLVTQVQRPNVFAMRAMLGNHHGPATMATYGRVATVPMLRIDDLPLVCDAIVVEDAHLLGEVLAGAVETIKKRTPIIVSGNCVGHSILPQLCPT